MGKRNRIAYRGLALALLLGCLVCVKARAMENHMIKVGLKYGDDAMISANLLNVEDLGLGYAMGYEEGGLFVPLGAATRERAVTMSVDGNVPLSDGGSIGGWHLELTRRFSTYEEAAAAAAVYDGAYVLARADGFALRVGQYLSEEEARAGLSGWTGDAAEVAGPSGTGLVVTVTGTNRILFAFDGGGERNFMMQPQSIAGEKTVTWFRGYRYRGSFAYRRTTGSNLTVINVVPLEDYIKGVIGWEIGTDVPAEALKAQAIVARNYAVNRTKHREQGFDLCPTDDCQVYQGVAASNEQTDAAVDATAGQFLYYNGELVREAVYFAFDGGATESSENVWTNEFPYLRGKQDPYEAGVVSRRRDYYWTKRFTAAELAERLNARGYGVGAVTNVYVAEYTATGHVLALTVDGTEGSRTFRKEACRTLFGLQSQFYTVSGGSAPDGPIYVNDAAHSAASAAGLYAITGGGTVTALDGANVYAISGGGTVTDLSAQPASGAADAFVFSGSGRGHGVGMSQEGAIEMAKLGMNYQEILQFYYTGVTIGS